MDIFDIKHIRDFLNSIKWGVLFTGLLGASIKVLGSWLRKKYQEIEKIRDEIREIKNYIERMDYKAEGRRGFVETVEDMEARLKVLEKIVDRRLIDVPIEFEDRRKNRFQGV
jgi:hypothetical protein